MLSLCYLPHLPLPNIRYKIWRVTEQTLFVNHASWPSPSMIYQCQFLPYCQVQSSCTLCTPHHRVDPAPYNSLTPSLPQVWRPPLPPRVQRCQSIVLRLLCLPISDPKSAFLTQIAPLISGYRLNGKLLVSLRRSYGPGRGKHEAPSSIIWQPGPFRTLTLKDISKFSPPQTSILRS